ncbi:MAG: hypothetical protein WC655_28395 [Candidatus Hydrogenedentales bacterium]|jgi:hypothetical protein
MNENVHGTGEAKLITGNGDNLATGNPHTPAVDHVVKEMLRDDSGGGSDPRNDIATYAAIQNLKRWFEGY